MPRSTVAQTREQPWPSRNTTTWTTTSTVSPVKKKLSPFQHGSASVVRALNPLESIASVRWTEAEEKVLGMYWQPATDDFKFGIKYHRVPRIVMTGERVPTKREFLSLVMSTFDPIGFLSCYMVTEKLLMREIWRKGVNWDEPLPADLAAAFEDWRKEMRKIEEIRCPRYFFGGGRVRMLQLHIFVDSSQSAFAAAAYWRATYANQDEMRSDEDYADPATGTSGSSIGHETDGHRQARAQCGDQQLRIMDGL
ncbi:uncharacterized protein LOC123258276 [Drosophila ananassae]|uniref:uncharacterized protein LOC123258276 n=1 Tax=Drosophila ananassae TaxID=7217 RepID=UPI001CFF6F7F|nr:uncharacterized protein LOC123258276 [Drosophila ananassae]